MPPLNEVSVIDLKQATSLARQLLDGRAPRRWEHSLGVLRQAESIAPALGTTLS
jgi:hypothetical protein